MVQTNFFQKEINLKFIFYGGDDAGKKTSLNSLHSHIESKEKSNIQEEIFESIRVHYFYHVPQKSLAGMKIKCAIYAIPEKGIHNEKILSIFQGNDSIIFVVDVKNEEKATSCFENLEKNLAKIEEKIHFQSLLIQYNKKDLVPEIDKTIEALNSSFNKYDKKHFVTSAQEEQEIVDMWHKIYDSVMIDVKAKLDSTTKALPKTKLKLNFSRKQESAGENLSIPKKFNKKEGENGEKNTTSNPESPSAWIEETTYGDYDEDISKEKTKAFHNIQDQNELETMNRLKVTNQLLSDLDASIKEQRVDTIKNDTFFSEENTTIDENVYADTINIKPVQTATQEIKHSTYDGAIEKIKNGEVLQNVELDILDLRNYQFVDPVRISKCTIGTIVCDGSDFNSSFIIEDTKITNSFCLSSNVGSLFRDSIKLKRLEISGEIFWDGMVACKEITILDSTWNCKASLQKCTFEKEVFIANSNLKEILFTDSNFRGEFTITGCRFEDTTDFQRSTTEERLYISGSYFQRCQFQLATCKGNLEIINTTFDKSANFKKFNADKNFCLEGCVFNGRTNFAESHLKGELEVRRTEFFDDVSFHKTFTASNQCFENVVFSSSTDFSKTNFNQVDFIQSNFKGIANFHEAIFSENTSFLESNFENTTHFSRSIFYKKVDFTECEFKGKVSFRGMIGDYVILHREQVEKRLLCDTEKNYEARKLEYLTLKRIMDQQRRFKDKDWAHYNAKRAQRKANLWSIAKPFKAIEKFFNWLFLDLGSRYGTCPQNIIYLGIVLWLFFGLIYYSFFSGTLGQENNFFYIQLGLDKLGLDKHASILSSLEVSLRSIVPGAPLNFTENVWLSLLIMLESGLGILLIFMLAVLLVRKLLQS